MDGRFAERMQNAQVRHDVAVLGDFTRIYCAGNHGDRDKAPCATEAASLGVYGPKPHLLCTECQEHLAYGEQRRAACTRDPKPFCAHCDSQCYRSAELAWQRTMMRYSGPRSWYRGHFLDSIRHAHEAAHWRRAATRAANQSTNS